MPGSESSILKEINGGVCMRKESVRSFFEKMVTDDSFATLITNCRDTEERIAFARTAGFDVDTEELLACGVEMPCDELNALLVE